MFCQDICLFDIKKQCNRTPCKTTLLYFREESSLSSFSFCWWTERFIGNNFCPIIDVVKRRHWHVDCPNCAYLNAGFRIHRGERVGWWRLGALVLATSRENKKVSYYCSRQQRLRIHVSLSTNSDPDLGLHFLWMWRATVLWYDEIWEPLSSFSKKLKSYQTRYSVFGRDLLTIYLAIRHFQHFVDGRSFTIYTNHRSLIYGLGRCGHHAKSNNSPFRQNSPLTLST